MEIILGISTILGIASAILFFMWRNAKEELDKLEVEFEVYVKEHSAIIDVLRKQNETLSKAAKSSGCTQFDLDKLFTGGF